MIDLRSAKCLSELARLLPPTRKGRSVSPSTLWRWCRHGLRGVKLEHIRIGSRTFSTEKALQEFLEKSTEAGLPKPGSGHSSKSTQSHRPRKTRKLPGFNSDRETQIQAAEESLRHRRV